MQRRKYTFRKDSRLKSKKSFQFVYAKGRAVADSLAVFYLLPDQGEDLRIGLAVGKRLGCAVTRNRIKRLMREVFRLHRSELKKGYHIVWVARRKLVQADFETFERVFFRLARKASLLQE